MYTVDDQDIVVPLPDIPQSCVGAPLPVVFAEEGTAIVAYIVQRSASPDTDDNAFLRFRWCYSLMFGPPNDEAFEGHPLAGRGLEPYGAFKIENSSWLRALERMNSVHPYHRPEHFDRYTHYVLTFHDSTFECIADSYEVTVVRGPLQSLLAEIDRLRHEPFEGSR